MAIINKIRITKNDANGNILPNPVVYEMCLEAFSLKEDVQTTDITCVTSPVDVTEVTGTDFSGGITANFTLQNAGIYIPAFFGEPASVGDYTSNNWEADTVYQKGDVVNHSDGKHSLVVKMVKDDGKSGSSEPTVIVGTNETTIVQDNNVTWSVVNKLIVASGKLENEPVLFSVEYAIDDNGELFYKRFDGVELSKFSVAINPDGGLPKIEADLFPMKSIDSEDPDWETPMHAISGVKLVKLGKDYYSGESKNQKVLLDDIEDCVYQANMDIDKGFNTKNCSGGVKKTTRKVKIDGKVNIDFTIDDYERYKAQSENKYTFEFLSGTGGKIDIFFPVVKQLPTDPDITSIDEVLLDASVTALPDIYNTPVRYYVVYPQFVATDGTIITQF